MCQVNEWLLFYKIPNSNVVSALKREYAFRVFNHQLRPTTGVALTLCIGPRVNPEDFERRNLLVADVLTKFSFKNLDSLPFLRIEMPMRTVEKLGVVPF